MPLLKSSMYQNGQGCPWFHAAAMFLQSKNSPSANVHGCTFADDVSVPSISKSAGDTTQPCIYSLYLSKRWRSGSFALGCLLGAILGASRFSSVAALFFVEDNPCFKFYKRTLII